MFKFLTTIANVADTDVFLRTAGGCLQRTLISIGFPIGTAYFLSICWLFSLK